MKRTGIRAAIFLAGSLSFLPYMRTPEPLVPSRPVPETCIKNHIAGGSKSARETLKKPAQILKNPQTSIPFKFLGPWLLGSQRIVFRETLFEPAQVPGTDDPGGVTAYTVVS